MLWLSNVEGGLYAESAFVLVRLIRAKLDLEVSCVYLWVGVVGGTDNFDMML